IREIPEPLVLIQRFVVGTGHRIVPLHLHSAVEIAVAAPGHRVAVCITRIARQNSNRADHARLRWGDFDAVDKRHLVVQGGEFQVQHPIVGRTNALEYFDVGGIASRRVGGYIQKSRQEFAAIGVDSKNTRSFAAAADVVFAENGFGKVEPQLIDALLQRNVVGEIALPPVIKNLRILGIGDRPRRHTALLSPLVIAVAGPCVPIVVYYLSRAGARQNPHLIRGRMDRLRDHSRPGRRRAWRPFLNSRPVPDERYPQNHQHQQSEPTPDAHGPYDDRLRLEWGRGRGWGGRLLGICRDRRAGVFRRRLGDYALWRHPRCHLRRHLRRGFARLYPPDELRNVVAGRQDDLDLVAGSLLLVVLLQALAQPVRLYTNNGISRLVEVWLPPEGVHRDIVFLDFVRLTAEVPFADVLKHLRHNRRTREGLRRQYGLKLRTFRLKV